MRRSLLYVLFTLALVLAGCGSDDGPAGEPSPTAGTDPSPTATASPPAQTPTESPTVPAGTETDGEVSAMPFATCSAERYTVGYPEDWNTNDPDEGLLDACELFHPGEIDVPDQPRDRDLHYAVSMYVDEVAYEDIRDADDPNEVLEERDLSVDGRDAFVKEIRSTGDALVPEGELRYAYVVDLDGEILVAVTHSVGDTDYERDKEVLDRMITEELELADDG